MKQDFQTLQEEIAWNLEKAALSYFEVGLELFHKVQNTTWQNFQPAIGNICIAVELLLKWYIAKKSIIEVFKNLPMEARLLLSMTIQNNDPIKYRQFAIDLRTFYYKTIEIDECIGIFYLFYPDKKQLFKPHLSLLSNIRNICVHAAIPTFQRYDLQRTAYLSIKLFDLIHPDVRKGVFFRQLKKKNDNFIREFDDQRVLLFEKKIREAKEKSKKITQLPAISISSEWEEYIEPCPIC